MKSVFANLELDTIRYSLVWEDWDTLYNNLNIQPGDDIAVITSAGCNVLNALLKNPASITAIDLNPVQNKLLLLKLHIIKHHNFNTWRNIMGFEGKEKVLDSWLQIRRTLDDNDADYWETIIQQNAGLMMCGKLEKYINGYFVSLPAVLQEKIRKLFEYTNAKDQYNYYSKNLLSAPEFIQSFTTYFADENLGRGRDPRLFMYAEKKGGITFFERLGCFLENHLASENFFLRFFFWGVENIPVEVLPPCHKPENYTRLKERIHTVSIVNAEAIEYLLAGTKQINKASLSNIFEYISHADFVDTMQILFAKNNKLRVLYWNLLQNQLPDAGNSSVEYRETATEGKACFYFNNSIIAQSKPDTNPKLLQV